MWRTALRDLQWRARRVVIAVVGAGLVFAMALVLAGFASAFTAEATHTIEGVGADAWIVPQGARGPFGSARVLPLGEVTVVRALPGVTRADPVLLVHDVVTEPSVRDVNILGFEPGGLGSPPVRKGRAPRTIDEIAADTTLPGARIGRVLNLSGVSYTIVGLTSGRSLTGGQPMLYTLRAAVERTTFPGSHVASAIVVRGIPAHVPAGLTVRTRKETISDTLRPVKSAISTIRGMEIVMIGVAGLVIGSVIYLSTLERVRDFAVFKATGASSRSLLGGLVGQAVALAVTASLVGAGLAHLIVPFFPLHFPVPLLASLLLPAIAVGVGALASVAGLRRAVGVDPAIAFGGP